MTHSLKAKLYYIWTNFYASPAWKILIGSYLVAIVGGLSWFLVDQLAISRALIAQVSDEQAVVSQLQAVAEQYEELRQDDQLVKNASLSGEIENIYQTYTEGAKLFEERADLVIAVGKVSSVDIALAKYLRLLGNKDWTGAIEQAKKVRSEIDKIVIANAPKVPVIANTPANNTAPSSGYARQKVSTVRGDFVVSLIVAPGARAVVETASDADCSNNCPTKSLAEHVAASGGFAGINGAYFCPPDYPQCQGKINSFDTLAVNGRSKTVINRANNVYSTVPLVAAYGTSLSFYDQTVQWGADSSGGGGSSALWVDGTYKVGPGRSLPTAIVLVR